MIRISVETEDELQLVRDYFVKPSFCNKISADQCNTMPDCDHCARDIAPKYIQVTMRKVIEEPQDLVL